MIGLKEYYHKAEVGKVGIRGNNPKQLKQVSLQHRPEHDAKRLICFARSQILCLWSMVGIQKEAQEIITIIIISFLQGRVIWLCLFCLFPSVLINSKVNLPLQSSALLRQLTYYPDVRFCPHN